MDYSPKPDKRSRIIDMTAESRQLINLTEFSNNFNTMALVHWFKGPQFDYKFYSY